MAGCPGSAGSSNLLTCHNSAIRTSVGTNRDPPPLLYPAATGFHPDMSGCDGAQLPPVESSITNPETPHSRQIPGGAGMAEPAPLPGDPRWRGEPGSPASPMPTHLPAVEVAAQPRTAESGVMEQLPSPALWERFSRKQRPRGQQYHSAPPIYFSQRRTAKKNQTLPFPAFASPSPCDNSRTGLSGAPHHPPPQTPKRLLPQLST